MQSNTFRLGITMAGAISAGAYTAGFIDYLIETLDKWERAKASGLAAEGSHPALPASVIPRHRIVIEALSGTSAGGMVGALSFFEFHDAVNHIRTKNQPDTSRNRLYNAWVKDVDISHMLETGKNDDIEKAGQVESFLHSGIIEKIADKYTDYSTLSKPLLQRSYVSDNLEMLLTISNMRGVPYRIQFNSNNPDVKQHDMLLHQDRLHFELSRDGNFRSGGVQLQTGSPLNWDALRTGAMATGAFPIFLLSRIVSRTSKQMSDRTFSSCEEDMKPVAPDWPDEVKNDPNYIYKNITVDGGLFHNEAFDLVRQRLIKTAGDGRKSNPRNFSDVDTAVIMIDPFPNQEKYDLEYDKKLKKLRSLVNMAGQMFSAMRSQLLFKITDIQLANDPEVYSRFLVVPTRSKDDSAHHHPIACGSLGGFGGFLSEEFRKSDFQLGRKNCQDFLRYHLVIPMHEGNIAIQDTNALRSVQTGTPLFAQIKALLDKESNRWLNPLFHEWTVEMVIEFGIINQEGYPKRIHLPIIPDPEINRAAIGYDEYKYPAGSFTSENMTSLRGKVKTRTFRVIKQLISDMGSSSEDDSGFWKKAYGFMKWALLVIGLLPSSPVLLILYMKYRKEMIDWIMGTIKNDLTEVKLYKE